MAHRDISRRVAGGQSATKQRPWSDGTTAFVFTPEEFVGRLAALVPPPQSNLVVYRGVLAARSRFRARVVALAQSPARETAPGLRDRHQARRSISINSPKTEVLSSQKFVGIEGRMWGMRCAP